MTSSRSPRRRSLYLREAALFTLPESLPRKAARRATARADDSVDGLGLRREALRRRVGGDTLRGARAVTRRVPFWQPAVGRIWENGLALVVLLLLGRAVGGVGRARTRLGLQTAGAWPQPHAMLRWPPGSLTCFVF